MAFTNAFTLFQRLIGLIRADGSKRPLLQSITSLSTEAPAAAGVLGASLARLYFGFGTSAGNWIGATPIASGTAVISATDTTAAITIPATDTPIPFSNITAKSGGSSSATVATVAVSGTTLTITLNAAPGAGETTTVSYLVFDNPA